MRVVALTGNIASGKSTVAEIFRDLGTTVIDLDAVVHDLQRAGQSVFKAIVARFGSEILGADGELDRPRLREIMVTDATAKHDLEALVHPAVLQRQRELLTDAAKRREKMLVVEIPLLFEAADPMDYDGIILVDAPVAVRRQRLLDRGMDPGAADRIMAAQMDSDIKRPQVTWIIDNDGDLANLTARTQTIWKSLQR